MEGSHSITDIGTVKHTNVYCRLYNSPVVMKQCVTDI